MSFSRTKIYDRLLKKIKALEKNGQNTELVKAELEVERLKYGQENSKKKEK